MATRDRQMADSDEAEMSSLQPGRRASSESQRRLHKDPERQREMSEADRNTNAAYRKSVRRPLSKDRNADSAQAIRNPHDYDDASIRPQHRPSLPAACPFELVLDRPVSRHRLPGFHRLGLVLRCLPTSVFFGRLGSVAEGRRRALQHLGALFVVRHRGERWYQYRGEEPSCELFSVM